jgi:Na+/H+ antiporter NhaC
MADIDVVKKSSHTWLWIVVALVIVIALFFLFGTGSETRSGVLDRNGGQPLAAGPSPAHVYRSTAG